VDVFTRIAKNINNYLKTPEQIESEICAELIGGPKFFDHRLNGKTDGYIHIHGSDEILSGHMEENY
jgi:hypothetical protein